MKRNLKLRILIAVLTITSFLGCNKKADLEDFELTYTNLSVIDAPINSVQKILKRKGGGYLVIGTTNISGDNDDGIVLVLNSDGKLDHSSTFGGNRKEIIRDAVMDTDGNVYAVGTSRSANLRMDNLGDGYNGVDGYLAKIDNNGNLLWQRGICDTTSLLKGKFWDVFQSVYLSGNQLVCTGYTENWSTTENRRKSRNSWAVTVDFDGNIVRQNIFPPVIIPRDYSGFEVLSTYQMTNGNIVFKHSAPELIATNRNFDTTCMITLYNPTTDNTLWTKGYFNFEQGGDALYLAENSNGNLVTINSLCNQITTLNINNGDGIGVSETGVKSIEGEKSYTAKEQAKKFGNGLYFFGNTDEWLSSSVTGNTVTVSSANAKPWIVKLTLNGTIDFQKNLDGYKSQLRDAIETPEGNLLVLGQIDQFETQNAKRAFLMTIDKDGNFVKPK